MNSTCSAFGLAFQRAAHISGARTRHNAFEASVVEVRKDDLDKFLVSGTRWPGKCVCAGLTRV